MLKLHLKHQPPTKQEIQSRHQNAATKSAKSVAVKKAAAKSAKSAAVKKAAAKGVKRSSKKRKSTKPTPNLTNLSIF